jgi:hypothetical protein
MSYDGAQLKYVISAVGPFRHSRLVRDLVACGEQQTLIRTSTEWLGSV